MNLAVLRYRTTLFRMGSITFDVSSTVEWRTITKKRRFDPKDNQAGDNNISIVQS